MCEPVSRSELTFNDDTEDSTRREPEAGANGYGHQGRTPGAFLCAFTAS